MNFIKKYWAHLINIIYLIIINITIYSLGQFLYSEVSGIFIIFILVLIILLVVFSIGIWAEIIGFIIHSIIIKDNKNRVIDSVLIFFLNIYYIPCYYLKQVVKDTKLALHNAIYIIITVFLSITGLALAFFVVYRVELYENNHQYQTFVSDDNFVKFEIPKYYKIEKVGYYDLYFSNKESVIGVFLYNDDGNTKEELIKYHDNFFLNTRDEVVIIDNKEYNQSNKSIITHTLKGKKDGSTNIYINNFITFDEYPNYVIYVVEICLEEYYDDYKVGFERIIDDISLNKDLDLI